MIDIEKLCEIADQTDAWEDNNAAYYALGCLKPNYPMPAIPIETGVTCCKGLLGECINCIWPSCE